MKATSLIPTLTAIAALLFVPTTSVQAELFLGPPNPILDYQGDWFSGASGSSFVSFSTEGGYIENTGRINLGATATSPGNADFRSQEFPLGLAAEGAATMTLEFYVKLTQVPTPGDALRFDFRFFSNNGPFMGETLIFIGSETEGLNPQLIGEWQLIRRENIVTPAGAQKADIRVSANIFSSWASGEVQFDAFQVTTPFPDLQTPVGIKFFPANEVEFLAESGKRYRIESSADLEEWTPASEIIVGNDQTVTRMFTTRDGQNLIYRVLTD